MKTRPPPLSLRRPRFCFGALAVLLCATMVGHSQVVMVGQDGEVSYSFCSLGIDVEGRVFVVGEVDVGGLLFRFNGSGFEVTPVPPLPGDQQAEVVRISRDADYLVGSSDSPEIGNQATLWVRSELDQPRGLGALPGGVSARPTDVASTPSGPLVIGYAGVSSFVWTEQTGMQPWITNTPYLALLRLERTTSDGSVFVGWEGTLAGAAVITKAILGTAAQYDLLGCRGSTRCSADAISPGGNFACGVMDSHSVVWKRGKPEFLSFRANFHGLVTVTDSGFAGGVSSLGGVIYGGHGRTLELFDEWWASRFPSVPLPGHITRVVDLYEHNGSLYCLLDSYDPISQVHPSLLAIVPLPHGDRASVSP